MDIFNRAVKPLLKEHMHTLREWTDLITWHTQEAQTLRDQSTWLASTIAKLQGIEQKHFELGNISHSQNARLLLWSHEMHRKEQIIEAEKHELTAQILQDELGDFLIENYHIKAKDQWHLDIPGQVLYRVPDMPQEAVDHDAITTNL